MTDTPRDYYGATIAENRRLKARVKELEKPMTHQSAPDALAILREYRKDSITFETAIYAEVEEIDTIIAAIEARDAQLKAMAGALGALKFKIDARLESHLCEMEPNYDDSITGFNEAWGIVSKTLAALTYETPVGDLVERAKLEAGVVREAMRLWRNEAMQWKDFSNACEALDAHDAKAAGGGGT